MDDVHGGGKSNVLFFTGFHGAHRVLEPTIKQLRRPLSFWSSYLLCTGLKVYISIPGLWCCGPKSGLLHACKHLSTGLHLATPRHNALCLHYSYRS